MQLVIKNRRIRMPTCFVAHIVPDEIFRAKGIRIEGNVSGMEGVRCRSSVESRTHVLRSK
jgi:hypothetical protein